MHQLNLTGINPPFILEYFILNNQSSKIRNGENNASWKVRSFWKSRKFHIYHVYLRAQSLQYIVGRSNLQFCTKICLRISSSTILHKNTHKPYWNQQCTFKISFQHIGHLHEIVTLAIKSKPYQKLTQTIRPTHLSYRIEGKVIMSIEGDSVYKNFNLHTSPVIMACITGSRLWET